jgi:hypothetical protein
VETATGAAANTGDQDNLRRARPRAGTYRSDGPQCPLAPPNKHERPSMSVIRQRPVSTPMSTMTGRPTHQDGLGVGRSLTRSLREPGHVRHGQGLAATRRDGVGAGHEVPLIAATSAQDRRAINVPLTGVTKGQPRLLRSTGSARSARQTAVTVRLPKLIVGVRFPSPAPGHISPVQAAF